MAQNITLLGASYTAVPAVTLPKTGGGTAQFDDTTDADATAADITAGKTAYVNGVKLTGTGSGGGAEYTRTIVVPQQTVTMTTIDSHTAAYLSTGVNVLEADAEYIITFNGDEYCYTCTSAWYGKSLGDLNYLWGTSTEHPYPFLIQDDSSESHLILYAYDGYVNTNVTVKVEKVELLSGGTTLTTKSITQNGTYNAEDDNADGYSEVTVNVSGGVTPAGTKVINITENGVTTEDITQYADVQISVNVPATAKNVQTAQSTTRRNNTALGSITSLTCLKAGTYDVYWSCARSSTSGTWGSQLYIDGVAYGTENTTFTNHVQVNHLSNVTIPANATVAVYGRSRSGYYIYASQLTIVEA